MSAKGIVKKEITQETTLSLSGDPTNQQNQFKALSLHLCTTLRRYY